jgi:alkylated DNA repair dioxygenase AlkB
MLQAGLFESQAPRKRVIVSEGTLPSGLIFLPDFISTAEERELVALLDDPNRAIWLDDLSRRVQHFGYRYNYKLRALSAADKVADAPPPIQALGNRLVDLGYFSSPPDQVIVNEYEVGQGISAHVDRETCFGSAVASLSIGSDVVMDFRSMGGASGSLLLPARSLVVLTDDARYNWKHSIPARRRDRIAQIEIARKRRLSLTFRTVLLDEQT